jgi:dipeptidyl aminopeptidase/acylaminoacyl peptidase
MINRLVVAAIALVVPIAASAAQAGPAQPQRATFVVTVGTDTLAVESVTRMSARVESDLAVRGQGANLHFVLALDAQALVSSMEIAVRLAAAAPDAAPVQAGTLAFRGDSVIGEMTAPARSTQRLAVGAGALPFVNLSMATAEQLVRRARVVGGARVQIPMFAVGGAQVLSAVVTWTTPDSVVISLGGVDLRAAVGADGRVLGAVVPSQGVRFTRVDGAARVAMSLAPPDYGAPAGAPYTAEDVIVRTTGGLTLAGTLTLPKQRGRDGRVPAVVLITGSGLQNRDEELPGIKGYRFFRQIADTLSRRGVAVLRLDDRGIGGSQAGDKPGTTGDFADDVRAALAYLRARPDIRADRLGLVGHSEGGIIAPMVARDDPQLRAIAVLAGPSRTIRRILEFQRRVFVENDTTIPASKRDSALAVLARGADSAASTPGWLAYLYDYDPVATARRVRQPVLILHGATDLQVTADQALELSSALHQGGNRDVTIHVFTKTNHLFLEDPSGVYSGYSTLPSKTVKPEVLGVLADWVVRKLGGG